VGHGEAADGEAGGAVELEAFSRLSSSTVMQPTSLALSASSKISFASTDFALTRPAGQDWMPVMRAVLDAATTVVAQESGSVRTMEETATPSAAMEPAASSWYTTPRQPMVITRAVATPARIGFMEPAREAAGFALG